MKVMIKSFDVEMQVKSNGIELEVHSPNGKEQIGDCYATMTGLVWCVGRKGRLNGVEVSWSDFITICRSEETLKAAVKAAKKV